MGRVRTVSKYYPGNYGAPGVPRDRRRKRSQADIARQNQKNRENTLQRLLLANFEPGDLYITLTYAQNKRPPDVETLKAQLKEFQGRMRRECKRAGVPYKWIRVTEIGKRGAVHHHMVMQNIAGGDFNMLKTVRKLWTFGGVHVSPLYEDGEYKDLAKYMVKAQTKEDWGGTSYSRSRNLVTPEPKREIIHHRRWNPDPKPPKGWYIVPGTLINGTIPYNGRPYQHYTMRKITGG